MGDDRTIIHWHCQIEIFIPLLRRKGVLNRTHFTGNMQVVIELGKIPGLCMGVACRVSREIFCSNCAFQKQQGSRKRKGVPAREFSFLALEEKIRPFTKGLGAGFRRRRDGLFFLHPFQASCPQLLYTSCGHYSIPFKSSRYRWNPFEQTLGNSRRFCFAQYMPPKQLINPLYLHINPYWVKRWI
jgi:hypothetical protein